MVKVSIIVPIYNMEKYLDRCMSSLLAQTLDSIELILVDDGSQDKSYIMCDDYANKYANIKVIHKKNAGLGMARNSGLDVATGEWVGFVDSDDFIEHNMYEILHNLAVSINADMVSCCTYSQNSEPSQLEYKVYEGQTEIKQVAFGMTGMPPCVETDMMFGMSVWRSIYKRKIIEDYKIRFYSEREYSSEDLPFNLQYLSHISKLVYTNAQLYHYCYNQESLSHTFKPEKLNREFALVKFTRELLLNFDTVENTQLIADRLLLTKMRITILQCTYSYRTLGFTSIYMFIHNLVRNPDLRIVLKRYPGYKLKKNRKLVFYFLKHKATLLLMISSFCYGKKSNKI